PNHASPSNEVFYKHPEFLFADAGIPRSQWFDVVDLDYANPDVWKFMVNVAEYWIREFDFDGFGIDVPDLIPRNFFRYMKHRLIKAKGGDVFILGESSGNGIEKWGMDCRYGFLSFFQMKEIFEGVIPPPKPPQRVISHLVKRLHPNETWEAFGPLGANYGLKRHIETYGDALTKCSAVIMTTLPFVPEVFAGMEIFEYRDESSAIGFMIKMLNLRQRHSALRSHNVQMVEHDHPEIACAYLKHARNEIALVIVNFRKSEVKLTLSIPTNAIAPLKFAPVKDLLTGKPVRLEWVGKNEISIKLPPFGVVLYVAPLRGKNYAVLSTVPHFTQSHPNTCGASTLAT
ncbi:MAG TPA: hypothetical protein EYP10_11085, partial [Armatimonadetes bacterium]|nr:hypothetical protein [Armatimonadota bacterium]